MKAAGEKLPVPDAPALAPDVNVPDPIDKSKPAVVKTSTTENRDLVVKAIANNEKDLKLMGSSAQKSSPQNVSMNSTLAVKAINSTIAGNKNSTKADASEFEKDFVDVDEDQDSKPPGKEEKVQTDIEDKKEMSITQREVQKLKFSIAKMESHLEKARAALENHKTIEKGINTLATTQHGLAKKELMMSVKRQEDSIQELQNHIKKGEEVLALKKTELSALESVTSVKSAVKNDPKSVAEASKKQAVSELEKTKTQIEKQVEKLEAKALVEGIDIKGLTEKNNKLWEQKYNDTLKQYEKEMKETEAKYQKELKDKSLVYEQESNQLTEKHKAELAVAMKKYQDLKDDHDKQVKDLFENIATLKFTKEMRFFKKQWDEQKVEKKRKKVAAAMANATKAWVSDGEKIE